jgi:periodic tryptophan protein 2
MAISSDSRILVVVDDDGRALFINFLRKVVICRFNFNKPVRALSFSPNNDYIAVSHGNHLQLWTTPGMKRSFSPLALVRTFGGHYSEINSIDWSPDGQFLLTGSEDMTARIFSANPIKGFHAISLAGHRDEVVNAFFTSAADKIITVCKDGAVFEWQWVSSSQPLAIAESGGREGGEPHEVAVSAPSVGEGRWSIEGKHYIHQDNARIQCASFHKKGSLLVVGFSTGIFGLYETPGINLIHTLSISQKRINSVAINATGEWLAFGSAKLGQLLVWEWQSETYVMKQQGHFYDLNVLDYSPDGTLIATGADDGKVKIWNTSSGFCFVTFSEHTSGITDVKFVGTGHAVVSSSLDGTVRAFDMIRYRNFRTMTTPTPVQLHCLAVDKGGEIVAAGAMDPFNIYVWSLQTGNLLDIFSGHEGPVVALDFSPSGLTLASGSWDKTVRMWELNDGGSSKDPPVPLVHTTDVLSLAYRPDGEEIAVTTLDGQISLWAVKNSALTSTIDGRRDVSGGRKEGDVRTAKNNPAGKCFTSITYTADGSCVLAGGRSKYVCIYETSHGYLLKKFQISHNRSIEGILDKLHSGQVTEWGTMADFDLSDDDEDARYQAGLPGVKKGDLSSRKVKPEVRSKCVRFSPNGSAWAAASTEGLLIYSLDENIMFDPFDLDVDITPDTIRYTLTDGLYARALLMSLHLNEKDLIIEALESPPLDSLQLVIRSLPNTYLQRLLDIIAERLGESPHVEYYMSWVVHLLSFHGSFIQANVSGFMRTLRALHKSINIQKADLSRVCDENSFNLRYLSVLGSNKDMITLDKMDVETSSTFVRSKSASSGGGKRGRSEDVVIESVFEEEEGGDDEVQWNVSSL